MAGADAGGAAPANTISLDLASALLMMTPQHFLRLVKQGYIPREARGTYTIKGAVQGYIRFLKDEERRSSKSAAASKLQDVKAREVEQRIAREAKSLIDFDEAMDVNERLVGLYNARLDGLPAACTRDLALQRVIEAQVDDIKGDVAKLLGQWAASVRGGGGEGAPDAEDDG